MLAGRLKTETRAKHDAIEAAALSSKITDLTLTSEDYKGLIAGNYIIHKAMEKVIEAHGLKAVLGDYDFAGRDKLPALERDAGYLGISTGELPVPDWANEFNNASELLGALYVIEGSTLGGNVIAKHLKKNANLEAVTEYHFYGCYGAQTGPMWKAFQGILTESALARDEDAVVRGANKAYALFTEVFAGVMQPAA